MANAGLSVKERLALLQNNNNNNTTSSSNNHNAATSKPAPVIPKPKPSPAETKPPGIAGFKPVTPSKPVAPQSHKPGTDKPTPSPPDKPSTATKPLSPANKPVTASKPALGTKPAPAAKPFTAAAAGNSQPGVEETGWPKLRHVGAGKETTTHPPPVSQKSASSSCEPGGETPAVPASSNSSQEAGETAMSSEMQEKKPGRVITPLKPVSVQERLAAIRQKSLEAECKDLKPKHHNGVSPTPQSTSTPKPSSVFPPASSPVSGTLNGQLPDNSEQKSELEGIKRSDIAKSLTHAADRILRNKAAAPTADSASEEAAAAPQRGSHLFQRRSDGKKFRKLDVSSLTSSEPAPAKPRRIDNVDLKPFLKAYATAKEKKLEVDAGKSGAAAEGEEGEMEEMYMEAESSSVTIRGRKGSVKRATTARVSFIPEYTEEEEEQELYTDGTSGSSPAVPFPSEPEETYDDCQSAVEQTQKQPEPPLEEPDEIYEPLDEAIPEKHDPASSESIPPPLPSPNTPDDKKAREKDRENKEKEEMAKRRDKAKEEANKKEEKERKKKEEELKKMRRKFGLNDSHEKVGDGVVKSNASGGVFSKDLAVVRGETIAILRIDGNPAGKWLAQNEQGKIGFVNSNNIEISTPTIKNAKAEQSSQLMAGVKHETGPSEEPEEMYEALPEGEMDEIYEEL